MTYGYEERAIELLVMYKWDYLHKWTTRLSVVCPVAAEPAVPSIYRPAILHTGGMAGSGKVHCIGKNG